MRTLLVIALIACVVAAVLLLVRSSRPSVTVIKRTETDERKDRD